MPARLPNLTLLRLWAALLLATIGLHAAVPVATPLEQRHGSAFSAATPEVALASQRRSDAVRIAIALQPLLPTEAVATRRLSPALSGHRRPAPRPDPTGPPARDILVRQPAPRGPPLA